MAHESMPRSFFITKKDMEQHGYSAKCRRLARRGRQKKRFSGTTSDHGLENQKPADRPTNDETSA